MTEDQKLILGVLKAADSAAWDQIRLLEGALMSAREVANKTSVAIIRYRWQVDGSGPVE